MFHSINSWLRAEGASVFLSLHQCSRYHGSAESIFSWVTFAVTNENSVRRPLRQPPPLKVKHTDLLDVVHLSCFPKLWIIPPWKETSWQIDPIDLCVPMEGVRLFKVFSRFILIKAIHFTELQRWIFFFSSSLTFRHLCVKQLLYLSLFLSFSFPHFLNVLLHYNSVKLFWVDL